MKLIIALGNPESRYDGTRHNIGYAIMDRYVKQNNGEFAEKSKFKAMVAELRSSEDKIVIAKPSTYYNLVGESYRALADFYKVAPEDVLIIADDLALPLGTIRTRQGGSDAGNNGIKSINAHGGEMTQRLRIGTAVDRHESMQDADFVLSKLSKSEIEVINTIYPVIDRLVANFVSGKFDPTTHRHTTGLDESTS